MGVPITHTGEQMPPAPFFRAESGDEVEPVTTWADDKSATPTARLPVTSELLDDLACIPTGQFDFAVYRPGVSTWVACAIPHEEVVLVRDDQLLEALLAAGLSVSTAAPDWW